MKTELSKNNNLHKAKKEKNDEFYTQLPDIENELKHYKEHFKNKIVFLNCDDPKESNFWKYFMLNFEHLGLKKLISTHFEKDEGKESYKLEICQDIDSNGNVRKGEVNITSLKGNGDFRSEESIELLKEADIVVTNPPFSLFREYVGQLIEYKKQFLVIGNMNATTYKEVFGHIKDNNIWLGISPRSMTFKLPDNSSKSVNSVWYTNLIHKKRNEEIILYKEYKGNELEYPKYDNYDVINIDKIKEIPKDYNGIMGVPITFVDKYNPNQFEILGLDNHILNNGLGNGCNSLKGKKIYRRLIIKNKQL